MFFDNPAAKLAARRDRETHGAIARFNFDDERAEHVEPEALPALAVLLVLAHWRRDVIVDPVAAGLIVVVGAAATKREGANVLDGGHGHSFMSAVSRCRRPAASRRQSKSARRR
jgi:hypothetical protein